MDYYDEEAVNVVCIDCQDHTTGNNCELCEQGFEYEDQTNTCKYSSTRAWRCTQYLYVSEYYNLVLTYL